MLYPIKHENVAIQFYCISLNFASRDRTATMNLYECYQLVSSIYGANAEPYEVVECVEKYRRFWRPEHVHTILLAESHVYTPESDCIEMKPRFSIPDALSNAPSRFTRFVYCPGYGEKDYVGNDLLPNSGTWQYWKIFSSCVYEPSPEFFSRILKRNKDAEARMLAKSELLVKLKKTGVWLVDASILALYGPGKSKPTARIRKRIIECCWDNYICNQIVEANPRSIIVIGKDVNELVKDMLKKIGKDVKIDCVPQPQGCRSKVDIEKLHKNIYELCRSARSSSNATQIDGI